MQVKQKQAFWILPLAGLLFAALITAGIILKTSINSSPKANPTPKKMPLSVGPAFDYPPDKTDPIQELILLQNRQFDELVTLLEGHQKEFEQDFRTEFTVYDDSEAFAIAGDDLLPYLNEWVSQKPGASAYLARAAYYKRHAWDSRGAGYASETSKQQFADMEKFFKLEENDCKTALTLNPNMMPAYGYLEEVAMARGSDAQAQEWFNAGSKKFPYSIVLAMFHMNTLTPRWGGSYGAMEEFADRCDKLASQNQNLRVIRGLIAADRALDFFNSNQNQEAVEQYTEALKYGEFYGSLVGRGYCLIQMGKYPEALSDLERALKLRPHSMKPLYLQAATLIFLNRYDEGINKYTLAMQIDPQNDDVVEWLNWSAKVMAHQALNLYQQDGKEDAALQLVNKAIALDPNEAGCYQVRAIMYYYSKKPDPALVDVQKAIALNSSYFEAYQLLGNIYFDRKQWDDVITTATTCIKLKPKNPHPYVDRAKAYRQKNNLEAATADLKTACNLGFRTACLLLKKP